MSGRRGLLTALGLVALGAVLVLATAGQPRWSVPGATSAGATSGTAAPAATALALVALAGAGLLLLLRGVARPVVGVLLLMAGIGVIVADVRVSDPGAAAFSPLSPTLDAHRTVWFWLTMAGGALITAGGALVTARGRSWPAARRAYDRTYDRQESRPTGRADAWTALDRGEDPTL